MTFVNLGEAQPAILQVSPVPFLPLFSLQGSEAHAWDCLMLSCMYLLPIFGNSMFCASPLTLPMDLTFH